MKIVYKLSAVVFTASLAACQHAAPLQTPPQPVDPGPPAVSSQGAQPPSSQSARQYYAQQQAQQQPQQRQQPQQPAQRQAQSTPVITLHLAQQKQEAPLVAVDVGASAPLYALPQPVLTQGDIARVQPVTASEGNFLLLEMNARGIPKLDSVTRQARGHFLLLSVQGQLVNVTRIGENIKDGRLLVATQSPQHTQAIIRLMQGKS